MPSVEILAVGTELLLGQLVDTNTAHVARALAENGVDVYGTHAVGDNRERIAAAIAAALERADGVVTTGGLGPTVDDLTKEAVCDALGCESELNAQALENIEEIFRRSKREMRENNRKQAEIPAGATVLHNDRGTAPGFIVQREDGKFVACMPGVPDEMRPMLEHGVLPWLRENLQLSSVIHTRVLHTINIAESEIDHRIDDLFRTLENPKIAVLAHSARCDVKIMAKAASQEAARDLIAPIEFTISKRLAGHIYGVDDQSLAGAVLTMLAHTEQTIGVAESCTGGRLAAEITAVPGSSKSFMGGVVAYDNFVKEELLGVNKATLTRFGAVSEETAREMAQGVRAALKTSIGIATTGVAGPGGGSEEKPVGLVWIGLADGNGVHAYKGQWRGSRVSIQTRATTHALGLLWRALARVEPF
ncbi:MAG TPA: competence/damage-inducible protein A [Candidatus Baltobacteraceae bacterium]|nr:competence/damage-inducible protein A [Candidatus Baltobacteraceae bacterium]